MKFSRVLENAWKDSSYPTAEKTAIKFILSFFTGNVRSMPPSNKKIPFRLLFRGNRVHALEMIRIIFGAIETD
ncbi:hypothetical protein GCM10008013_35060 [Paenibacillus segetis]|uniref:Uncharacterized protein n=1 Tax=Paenibacillus segetis TaxID=1325360 RepID=A0ABQ1YMY2_9BACL|nr:hypothetical protein GCM10008013_35060 [Paenibacillus segetis]